MTWTNWVGNQSFTPASTATPRDEDEVVALVREAARRGQGVRVAGAGHSFTPVVQTDGLTPRMLPAEDHSVGYALGGLLLAGGGAATVLVVRRRAQEH